jgi:hypothetical protein
LKKYEDILGVDFGGITYKWQWLKDGTVIRAGEYIQGGGGATEGQVYDAISPSIPNVGDSMQIAGTHGASITGVVRRTAADTITLWQTASGVVSEFTYKSDSSGTGGTGQANLSWVTLNTRWTAAQIEVS